MKLTELNIYAPVVITGRGGSGTRLLSRLIQHAQIFLGNRLNRQGDSLEWVKLNRKFLFDGISLNNQTFNASQKSQLISQAKQILYKNPDNINNLDWGFKLPEMLFMLPELFDAFPQAKLIHLIRHPVSSSLRRTHITSRMDNPVGQWVLPQAYQHIGLSEQDIECNSDELNNAISWKFQLDVINKFAENNLNQSNYLVIKFEELIDKPAEVYFRIQQFLGRDVNNPELPNILIDRNRAELENSDTEEVERIWTLCKNTAEVLGYQKKGRW